MKKIIYCLSTMRIKIRMKYRKIKRFKPEFMNNQKSNPQNVCFKIEFNNKAM